MAGESFAVDFPTLADLHDPWVQAHCSVPQGFDKGRPFVYSDWQFWCGANHYAVKRSAKWQPVRPLMNEAFVYRQSLIVGPQKFGKGPYSASQTAIEAVGPSLFAGWAEQGDGYACSDWGCGCGFEYEYDPGDPMGMPHPSPLIQLTATSEDQVDNVYGPLKTMVRNGPLGDLMLIREGFIRLPGDECRIDAVTASANSRLGNPISYANQDEGGLYTDSNKLKRMARTQRRGVAGMRGRSSMTTNTWDPSEMSDAQEIYESIAKDVFKFYRIPPKQLSWNNKRERREILKFVYADAPWTSIPSIEADAAAASETNPGEAERFYGNRVVAGAGTWLPDTLWDGAYANAD